MSKTFWGIIVAIVVVFVAIFALTGGHNKNNGSGGSSSGKPTEHIEGKGSAGVTLVEYGDFQCPYCGEAYPTVKQLVAQFNDQIYFQFRNFPLTNLHPNAFAGARAAEAAALQGKYWQMHDLLYEQNDDYYNGGEPSDSWIGASDPLPYFVDDARQLGLNVAKFKTDYASDQVDNSVNADMSAGTNLGVDATPTFILDGKQLNNPPYTNETAFAKIIQAEINKKEAAKTKTTSSTK